jgi:hypothetical protein
LIKYCRTCLLEEEKDGDMDALGDAGATLVKAPMRDDLAGAEEVKDGTLLENKATSKNTTKDVKKPAVVKKKASKRL